MADKAISRTTVTMTIVHRAEDRDAVQNAFYDWNCQAAVSAIWDEPEFKEVKLVPKNLPRSRGEA